MFRRHSDVVCYFCNSPVSLPQNPRSFRCNICGCWNRYDEKGEILSDEPAMHDESLNARSFSKRASPSKDRLPTMYGKGPFCHTCQTNQMLLVNLMSNYLPPSTSPEYEQRLSMLPEYRESLHIRYPPVCESCLPAVEDEIRKKEIMARTQALGGWLKETKGKANQRRVSAHLQERENITRELLVWRIRGCLWFCGLTFCISGNLSAVLGYQPFRSMSVLQPISPIIVLLSLLWTAWDPTYSALRKSQIQGKDIRVQGKRTYNSLQIVAWTSRFVTATFLALHWFHLDYLHLSQYLPSLRSRIYFSFSVLLELSVIIGSCLVLRLQQPPAIRLIDSKSHDLGRSRSSTPITGDTRSRATTPAIPAKLTEPDLFSSLSLSSKPVVQPKEPVFGLPSLLSSSAPMEQLEGDEMDWTPTSDSANPAFPIPPSLKSKTQAVDESVWLRPQRFFAPEKPTGLESLFEKTKLADDISMADASQGQNKQSGKSVLISWQDHVERWWWVYVAGLVLMSGVALKIWIGREISQSNIDVHASPGVSDGSVVNDEFRSSGLYRHTIHSHNNLVLSDE